MKGYQLKITIKGSKPPMETRGGAGAVYSFASSIR